MFKAKLTIGHKYYDTKREEIKAEGSTLMKALGRLKKPEFIKTPGMLEVKYKGKKTNRHMNIPRMNRLFHEKDYYREILAKNLLLFLK